MDLAGLSGVPKGGVEALRPRKRTSIKVSHNHLGSCPRDIAQAYNIPLTLTQEITMLLVLMLTSKGMAGVPRASLVVIAATLNQFNFPKRDCF